MGRAFARVRPVVAVSLQHSLLVIEGEPDAEDAKWLALLFRFLAAFDFGPMVCVAVTK